MSEHITVNGIAPFTSKSGKTCHHVTDTSGTKWWVWDAPVGQQIGTLMGQTIEVETDRSNMDYPKIRKVVGAVVAQGAPVPAPVAPVPAAPVGGGSATGGVTPAAPAPARSFQKDPVGLILSVREKALGCAIASFNDGVNAANMSEVFARSMRFRAHLYAGLEGFIPELAKAEVLPGAGGSEDGDDIPF